MPTNSVQACSNCGSTRFEQLSPRSILCKVCGNAGAPLFFDADGERAAYEGKRTVQRMKARTLWGQLVRGRSVPIVVIVNYLTALYFFLMFSLGMAGLFFQLWFQDVFLYLSITVVALGFGAMVRFGKASVNL